MIQHMGYIYTHAPSLYIGPLIILGLGMRVVDNGNNLREVIVVCDLRFLRRFVMIGCVIRHYDIPRILPLFYVEVHKAQEVQWRFVALHSSTSEREMGGERENNVGGILLHRQHYSVKRSLRVRPSFLII